MEYNDGSDLEVANLIPCPLLELLLVERLDDEVTFFVRHVRFPLLNLLYAGLEALSQEIHSVFGPLHMGSEDSPVSAGHTQQG